MSEFWRSTWHLQIIEKIRSLPDLPPLPSPHFRRPGKKQRAKSLCLRYTVLYNQKLKSSGLPFLRFFWWSFRVTAICVRSLIVCNSLRSKKRVIKRGTSKKTADLSKKRVKTCLIVDELHSIKIEHHFVRLDLQDATRHWAEISLLLRTLDHGGPRGKAQALNGNRVWSKLQRSKTSYLYF